PQTLARSLIALGVCQWWREGSNGYSAWHEAYEVARNQRQWGLVLTSARLLTEIAADTGDIVTAKELVSESDRVLLTIRSRGILSEAFGANVANNAEAHFFLETGLGHYATAEKWQRIAIENYGEYASMYDSPATWNYLGLDIGSIHRRVSVLRAGLSRSLVAQGRFVEAEVVARDGLVYALRHFGKLSPSASARADNLAQVLFVQGRTRDAEFLFSTSNQIRDTLGMAAENGRNWQADAVAMQGRWTEALAIYSDSGRGRTEISPYVQYPRLISLFNTGRVDEGLAIAQRLSDQRVRAYGEASYESALSQAFVAVGVALRGDKRSAIDTFRKLFPALVQSSHAGEEAFQQGTPSRDYQLYVLEFYLQLLLEDGTSQRSQAQVDEGFLIADAMRVAVTSRAISASVARARLPNAELVKLARQQQDARQELSARLTALSNMMASSPEQQNSEVIAALRTDIDRLTLAQSTLQTEIARHFPNYDALVNPAPGSIIETQAMLTAGEVVIAICPVEHQTFVWAVRDKGPITF